MEEKVLTEQYEALIDAEFGPTQAKGFILSILIDYNKWLQDNMIKHPDKAHAVSFIEESI